MPKTSPRCLRISRYYPRSTGLNLQLAVELDYDDLNRSLTGLLPGESLDLKGRRLAIDAGTDPDALIEAYADIPQLVDHLHLPVQSGSDRVLAAMKRNHTVLEYK